MSDDMAASVIRCVLRDLKTRADRDATDAHGQMLAALSAEQLTLFQSASALVHRGAIKKVTALPSRRSFFRVESLSRYHKQQRADESSIYGIDVSSMLSQPLDTSNGPSYYNVLPDHYCSCQAFHESAIQCPTAMCKHLVAVGLADATNQLVELTIQDTDFATMLCAQLHTESHMDEQQ
uniref:SWIM-type domain-containing protein n=1 Tax=Globisporangium ultimum (strain ATCC 200006 / CBS 805.95 / DAOM BR144) TaxID=431595 RepID=K3WFA8_GLOUD